MMNRHKQNHLMQEIRSVAYTSNLKTCELISLIFNTFMRYSKLSLKSFPFAAESCSSSVMKTHLSSNWFQLLQCCKNKHSRFSHARFCLTYNVHTKNCLRNALMLNWNKPCKPYTKTATYQVLQTHFTSCRQQLGDLT